MNNHYTIGLDYGSLSARGVLVNCETGVIIAETVMEYPHGIISHKLPAGAILTGEWMLQHPADYTKALEYIVPQLVKLSQVNVSCIVGIGIDFTASTIIPLDKDFQPLCLNPLYENRPHAWPKLWKHHGAHAQAKLLTELCKEMQLPYLDWYGGSISQETLIAKAIQVFQEDRDIYEIIDCFMEASDYITSLLTGRPVFGASVATAKALWSPDHGYPSPEFFHAVDPQLINFPLKLMDRFTGSTCLYPGEKAGTLCMQMATKLGLKEGISVSAPQMDAYAALPGLGIVSPGTAMMVIGTSTGIMLLSDKNHHVPGVTACLPDTYYPGLYGYASGQASVGDTFDWFIKHCVPADYHEAASAAGISIHDYLSDLVKNLSPGDTGLIALDWFNGNRSCLANGKLSGMILGLNLNTRPEHIYRALLEGTAFGARVILESYEKVGIPIKDIVICGGIALKNPFMMQIYADVLGKPIRVSRCTQAPALGSAIYAAAAAGLGNVYQMTERMGYTEYLHYAPDPTTQSRYEHLYSEYLLLHDYFGRGKNPVMEYLSQIRK